MNSVSIARNCPKNNKYVTNRLSSGADWLESVVDGDEF